MPGGRKSRGRWRPSRSSNPRHATTNSPGQNLTGTSTTLEKDYFRLTEVRILTNHLLLGNLSSSLRKDVKKNEIRPESILQEAFEYIMRRWSEQEVDYSYMQSQLKSIRQDLTVQHIRNSFTAQVYETHARLALSHQDWAEWHQCLGQLKSLPLPSPSAIEFIVYRLMYMLWQGMKRGDQWSALLETIQDLTPDQFQQPEVQHSLAIIQTVMTRNHSRFFSLYTKSPGLGKHLLDQIIPLLRIEILRMAVRAFLPEISLTWLLPRLHFSSEAECKEYLVLHGGILEKSSGVTVLNTRTSKII